MTVFFYGVLLAPRPPHKLEDHPLSVFRDCLFNIFADTLRTHTTLTTGVCLHDNARPHTATATVSTIEELRFECIPHPPYSPDLTPSDFHVFGPLKDALSGKQFETTMRFGRRCMSGCAPVLKNFFPAESTRLSSIGISALN